jgi:hypothetical protein
MDGMCATPPIDGMRPMPANVVRVILVGAKLEKLEWPIRRVKPTAKTKWEAGTIVGGLVGGFLRGMFRSSPQSFRPGIMIRHQARFLAESQEALMAPGLVRLARSGDGLDATHWRAETV